MTNLFKKAHLTLTALLLTWAIQADAAPNGSIGQPCIDPSCCPPICCEPPCCGKAFASIDLLYWRAFQGGLNDCFPIENEDYISSGGNVISTFKGDGKDPHFNWDAGFRIGTGYAFGTGWDIAAFWTHFHSESKQNQGRDQKLHWKLDFNVLDLVAGRAFDVGSCFAARPFFGLRAVRIEEKLRLKNDGRQSAYGDSSDSYFNRFDSYIGFDRNSYLNSSSQTFDNHDDFRRAKGHAKNKLMGVGPLIGVEGDWRLGCGFSLYANASVAVLYGNFRLHFHQSEEFTDGADLCEIKRKTQACQAVADLGLGIRWETCVCQSLVWLQLGLEHHRYFNQNRFGDYGDLCLDGANFSAGFAF
ncbi:MAG: Lpg1974 family pore-forming outer membrane protein [Parachlamydiaceae bacterium]